MDTNIAHWQVSGIFNSEESITKTIDALFNAEFARHDLAIQADPGVMEKKLDDKYVDLKKVQNQENVPDRPLFREDDLGWATAFIVTIPALIVIIIGLLLFWDSTSVAANYFTAFISLVIGLIIGGVIAGFYRSYRNKVHKRQFQKGGKVLWVHCQRKELVAKAEAILRSNQGHHIKSKRIA